MMNLQTLVWGICAGLCCVSCDIETQTAYAWKIAVVDQDNQPVSGVKLQAKLPDGSKNLTYDLGETKADGRLVFDVNLKVEGTGALRVICPTGYAALDASNEQIVSVVFRQSQSLSDNKPITVAQVPIATTAICKKTQHRLALLVKAPKAIGVPLKVNGLLATKIDTDGYAEIEIGGVQDTVNTVAFDTTDFPKLRPQNPVKTVQLGEHDAIEVWNQTFELAVAKARSRRPTKIKKLPTRIQ